MSFEELARSGRPHSPAYPFPPQKVGVAAPVHHCSPVLGHPTPSPEPHGDVPPSPLAGSTVAQA